MTNGQKELGNNGLKINILATKSTEMEIGSKQGFLPLGIEKTGDFGDVGMGVLSDGTPYLNQRGLGRIDIQRSQIMEAARYTKPMKWSVRRS